MKRIAAVVTLLFALSLMAVAHGKEKHVMGTVTSISDTSITVETTAKKSVTVEVTDKTKFEKSTAAATLKDLKVGDKVVIHADVAGDKLIANEVHFGAMKGKHSMDGMKGMEGMDHK
jgi:preprotein translocase subunit YajC